MYTLLNSCNYFNMVTQQTASVSKMVPPVFKKILLKNGIKITHSFVFGNITTI
jgi:hypothetical protein